MKRILTCNGLDKKEQYNILNVVPARLSDHVGETLKVRGFALTETVNDDGTSSKGFTMVTDEGEYLGTGGKAFVEGIETFLNVFTPEDLTAVTIGSKLSRSGREYIYFIA